MAVTPVTNAPSFQVYIGTQNPEKGILRATFDAKTGTLSSPTLAVATADPAFIALNSQGTRLYVCNTGTPGGLSAFAIDRSTHALTLLNSVRSVGRGPSHVSIDRSDRYVLNANYGGGYVEIHALADDGSLGERTAFVQLTGSSVHPQRQTKAYAHWFGVDPTNRFALIADLGTDRIMIYRFDASKGTLEPNDPPFVKVRAGSGPRHLAFHPNGRWLYAVQELSNEVIAYAWDPDHGVPSELQTVSTLPADYQGTNTAAEIAVHNNGRFLYVSNRGHDSLAVYAIDSETGKLQLIEHVSSRGKTPRYFSFDPTNRWLIVTNQEGHSAVVFGVDADSGKLTAHGEPIEILKPMGVVVGA